MNYFKIVIHNCYNKKKLEKINEEKRLIQHINILLIINANKNNIFNYKQKIALLIFKQYIKILKKHLTL